MRESKKSFSVYFVTLHEGLGQFVHGYFPVWANLGVGKENMHEFSGIINKKICKRFGKIEYFHKIPCGK